MIKKIKIKTLRLKNNIIPTPTPGPALWTFCLVDIYGFRCITFSVHL